jgi:phage replication O-like protein O
MDTGYTPIPNTLLDEICMLGLTGLQTAILLVVARQTLGYQKTKDWISLTQFSKKTKSSRQGVCKSLLYLVNQGLLVKTSLKNNKYAYGLGKTLLGSQPQFTSKLQLTQLVNYSLPTKEKHTKESTCAADVFTDYLDFFNKLSGKSYRPTDKKRTLLATRLKSYSIEDIKRATSNMFDDDFYKGGGARGWHADIEFILRNDDQIDKFLNKSKPLPVKKTTRGDLFSSLVDAYDH